jgi:hypothetical protein
MALRASREAGCRFVCRFLEDGKRRAGIVPQMGTGPELDMAGIENVRDGNKKATRPIRVALNFQLIATVMGQA